VGLLDPVWGRAFVDRFRLYHLLFASATIFSGKLLIFKDETAFGVKHQKSEARSQKLESVEALLDAGHNVKIRTSFFTPGFSPSNRIIDNAKLLRDNEFPRKQALIVPADRSSEDWEEPLWIKSMRSDYARI
jgi:hypothetical protein